MPKGTLIDRYDVEIHFDCYTRIVALLLADEYFIRVLMIQSLFKMMLHSTTKSTNYSGDFFLVNNVKLIKLVSAAVRLTVNTHLLNTALRIVYMI